jgi:hypothetical protein
LRASVSENLKKTTQKRTIRRTLKAHSGLILASLIVVAVVAAVVAVFLEASNHARLKVGVGIDFLTYHQGDVRDFELYIDGSLRARGAIGSGGYEEYTFDFVPEPYCTSYAVSVHWIGNGGATGKSQTVMLCRGESETLYFTI